MALRFHKDNYLVTLSGIADRTLAESFFQRKVMVENKPADFNFAEDILGKKVISLTGQELGVVTGIMESPLYEILVVRGGEKEILIPHIDQFVKSLEAFITVDMTGLEE